MSKLAKKLARAKHTEEYVRARQERMLHLRAQDPSLEAEPSLAVGNPDPQAADDELPQVARSAGIISICVALSRITGFIRTWSMAFALGATFLSSSYQVANNLPNQLYELVMGGMLVTAFLPVYISIKKKAGKEAGSVYASNLFTIVILFLGVCTALCLAFPEAIVYTQSFMTDQAEMGTAVLLFQFFAIQTVFYGASTIFSGLLNANREYLWSSAAPIFNNLVVIVTFLAYAAIAPTDPTLALYIIALGNPAGVLLQVLVQLPALKHCGIRLRPRLSLRDAGLRETLRLGLPALAITICTFITVSVMNAASYAFADNGPSVIAYARLWYTLPYSFLAIPITTALFTELSDMYAEGDLAGVMRAMESGTSQILFLLIPFALYLIVFSGPLVTLYHTGAFSEDRISQIAGFLAALALALPFYGVVAHMQKDSSPGHLRSVQCDRLSCSGGAHLRGRLWVPTRPSDSHRIHCLGFGGLLPRLRYPLLDLPESGLWRVQAGPHLKSGAVGGRLRGIGGFGGGLRPLRPADASWCLRDPDLGCGHLRSGGGLRFPSGYVRHRLGSQAA